MTVDVLLALAASLDWPALELKPAHRLLGGEAGYRKFTAAMTAYQHQLLAAALMREVIRRQERGA